MYIILLFLLIISGTYANEPKEEFRAVWLTTFAGLDWPGSFDPVEQKRSLLGILDHLRDAKFNAIFFQARSRGDAFYRSSFEPWARELTGKTGEDPGWDPLAFLIEEGHSRGLEVHAWFNVYKVWGGSPIPYNTEPPHILEQNPEWARQSGVEWWLNPGEPGVHTYLLKVALDLIERYPVDGIHFDHIRYPDTTFDDKITHERFGVGKDLHDWRRENITNFIRDFYHYASVLRPDLKIGSAPVGVYKPIPGFFFSTAYEDYYQDPERWLREGIHDYITPQVYWDIGQHPKFDRIMHDWKQRAHGRHIYGGIGIFRPEIYNEIFQQVSITRSLGAHGQVYFRYAHLGNPAQLSDVYTSAAVVPDMPWKNNNEPRLYTVQFPDDYVSTSVNRGEWQARSVSDYIDEIARMLDRPVVIGLEADPDKGNPLYLSMYLPGRSSVTVWIMDGMHSQQIPVIDENLDAGFHMIPVYHNQTQPFLRYVLQTGNKVSERLIKTTGDTSARTY